MIKTYPAIELVAKIGRPAAILIAVLVALAAIVQYAWGGSLAALGIGLLCAVIAFVVLRIAVELVEVIADTLLPR